MFGFQLLIVKIIFDRLRRKLCANTARAKMTSNKRECDLLAVIESDTEGKSLPPTAKTPHSISKWSRLVFAAGFPAQIQYAK